MDIFSTSERTISFKARSKELQIAVDLQTLLHTRTLQLLLVQLKYRELTP